LTIARARILVLVFWALVVAWAFMQWPTAIQLDPAPAGVDSSGQPLFWYKGNTHAHAKMTVQGHSHGDSQAAEVAGWYRNHGYHFIAIADHNRYTASVETVSGDGEFLVIPGMEVTSDHRYPGVNGQDKRKIHATALNTTGPVSWDFADSQPARIIDEQAGRIRAKGGLPILNHPNYFFQVTLQDILDAGELSHFELFNAHARANLSGHAGFRPSVEVLWDQVLSEGQLLYGVASDDAHDFKWYRQIFRRFGTSPPGGAWVMVRAPELAADSATQSLAQGDFYASTGVHLKDVSTNEGAYRVEIDLQRTLEEIQHRWVSAAAPVPTAVRV